MNNLTVTEYKNIRVLTTQQIADAYGTDSKTISYNFNHNKGRYKEGKHFILLDGEELRRFVKFTICQVILIVCISGQRKARFFMQNH